MLFQNICNSLYPLSFTPIDIIITMLKSTIYFFVFAAIFSLTYASNLNRRAVFNMMNGHNIKDQYHAASSNVYSARDENAVVMQAAVAPTKAVMRVGNEMMEMEEWIISGSPEFYQSYKPESIKRDRLMFASKVSNLKHSMRNKVESKHHQSSPLGVKGLTAKPYATGNVHPSFATSAPGF
ncbi:unnamed protein product [Rhizopus stolonifer]